MKALKAGEGKALITHGIMCFAGGFMGIYAIITRLNFGSAMTGNLLEMIINFFGGRYLDGIYRIIALIIYGISVVCSRLLQVYYKGDYRKPSIVIEAAMLAVAGLMPENMPGIIALYPVFVAAVFQWGAFSGALGFNSASIFSTNNYKQCVIGWTDYIRTKDVAFKRQGILYTTTLICFHLGAVAGAAMTMRAGISAIWLVIIPVLATLINITGASLRKQ